MWPLENFNCKEDQNKCYCGCANDKCATCSDIWKFISLKKQMSLFFIIFLSLFSAIICMYICISHWQFNNFIKQLTEEEILEINGDYDGIYFKRRNSMGEPYKEGYSFDSKTESMSSSRTNSNYDHHIKPYTQGKF